MADLLALFNKLSRLPTGLEVFADEAALLHVLVFLSIVAGVVGAIVGILELVHRGLRAYNGIRDERLRARTPPKLPSG